MHGTLGLYFLLAVGLMGRPWLCAADCDSTIENNIKVVHRDPMEFNGVFETLAGEYQVVLMSSGDSFVDQKGNKCIRMAFKTHLPARDLQLSYLDIADKGTFIAKLDKGVLIAKDTAANSVYVLKHHLVYLTSEVVAFYACSDAADDPPLALVGVSSMYTARPDAVAHHVQKAKQALEKVGVHGFATIPYCPNSQ